MALRTLTIFLAVSTVVSGLAVDGNALNSRSVPPCSALGTNPTNKPCYGSYHNGSIWQEFPTISHSNNAPRSVPSCEELGANPENKLCWMPGPYHNDFEPHTLSRRNLNLAQASLPEWSERVQGVWAGGNTTSFCIRDGPAPIVADIKKLCSKIDDSHIIARTKTKKDNEKDGACFCKKFHQGTAWLKVCNCDRCDRLEISEGLKDLCKASTELCASKGFFSGLTKLEEKNGLLIQYNVMPEHAKSGKMENDPIKARPELTTSTCYSNNENKYNQDYTGPAVQCWRSWKTFWMARKCHDHMRDSAESRSQDYWHNKAMRKLSDAYHSRSSK